MIDLIVTEKNVEKTIEGKIVRFDGITDARNLSLENGYVLRIDGTEEVVTRTEYDKKLRKGEKKPKKELIGFITTKKRDGKEVETTYQVNEDGVLLSLFSRVYNENGQS